MPSAETARHDVRRRPRLRVQGMHDDRRVHVLRELPEMVQGFIKAGVVVELMVSPTARPAAGCLDRSDEPGHPATMHPGRAAGTGSEVRAWWDQRSAVRGSALRPLRRAVVRSRLAPRRGLFRPTSGVTVIGRGWRGRPPPTPPWARALQAPPKPVGRGRPLTAGSPTGEHSEKASERPCLSGCERAPPANPQPRHPTYSHYRPRSRLGHVLFRQNPRTAGRRTSWSQGQDHRLACRRAPHNGRPSSAVA